MAVCGYPRHRDGVGHHHLGLLHISSLLAALNLAAAFIQPSYYHYHNHNCPLLVSHRGRLQASPFQHDHHHQQHYTRTSNDTITSSLCKTTSSSSRNSSSSSTLSRLSSSHNGGKSLSRAHLVRAAAAALALSPLLPPSLSLVAKPVQAASGGSLSSSLASSVGLLADVLPESVLVTSLPLKIEGFRDIGTSLNRLNDLRRLQFRKGQQICKDELSLPFEPAELVIQTADVSANGTAILEEEEGPEVSSFRWSSFRRIVEGVRTTFDREREPFRYALTIRANSSAESQQRRRQRFSDELKLLDEAITKLDNATKRENTTDTLKYQAECLVHLGHLGELMVAKFPFSPPKTDDRNSDDYYNLPRLFGRAEIELILRDTSKKGSDRGGGSNSNGVKNFTLIVDGFNAPISAGNFVDLCQRGFYRDLPLRLGNITTSRDGMPLNVTIAGTYKDGFVDPIKGKSRRVPLEIIRAEEDGMTPFYGQARNTKLFTRAPPLLSYRTPGAIGLYHPESDGNGANAEFFWLTEDARCMDQQAGTLDGRYTLIGYFIGDQSELASLTDDYIIEDTNIRWGLDHFVRSRVSFIDILLQGDE